MAAEILIIWPDPRWADQLHSALLQGGLDASVELLTRYPSPGELMDLMRQGESETKVVLIGLTDERRASALFQVAKEAVAGVTLIAVDIAESTDALKAAMRAGAKDYWTPPFNPPEIYEALSSLHHDRETASDGVLVSFLPGQPGDGASTAALHVAQAIGYGTRKPVLLIDCDLQCGTLGFRLGLKPDYSLLDAAGHLSDLDDLWDRIAVPWNEIQLLTAPESSFGLTGDRFEALPAIVESALRVYPYVLVDLPSALYGPCAGVLRRSNTVCVVCTPEVSSLHLTRRRFSDLGEWDIRRSKVQVLINRADSRDAPPRNEVERSLGVKAAWTLPNSYYDINQAALAGRTVDRESIYGQAIAQMASGLAGFEVAESRSSWRKLLPFG